MTTYRMSVSLVAIAVTAALTAGCASTGTLWSADRSTAHRVSDGAFIQMASLHAFHDSDTERPPADVQRGADSSDQADAPICRSQPPATGSRIGVRTMCMTGNEWEAKSLNDRDQLNDAESRALASTPYAPY